MASPAVVVGGSVSGNIGSCEIKSTDVALDSFHVETIAVNSCTGQIVAQNTYFNWSWIVLPILIVLVFGCIFWSIGWFASR